MDRDLSIPHHWDRNSGMLYPSLDAYPFGESTSAYAGHPKTELAFWKASAQTPISSTHIQLGHEHAGDWPDLHTGEWAEPDHGDRHPMRALGRPSGRSRANIAHSCGQTYVYLGIIDRETVVDDRRMSDLVENRK